MLYLTNRRRMLSLFRFLIPFGQCFFALLLSGRLAVLSLLAPVRIIHLIKMKILLLLPSLLTANVLVFSPSLFILIYFHVVVLDTS